MKVDKPLKCTTVHESDEAGFTLYRPYYECSLQQSLGRYSTARTFQGKPLINQSLYCVTSRLMSRELHIQARRPLGLFTWV